MEGMQQVGSIGRGTSADVITHVEQADGARLPSHFG